MTEHRPYSRHGLTAPMVRVKLRGFRAIDRRTAGGRETLALRSELIAALGGEVDLSPQRRRLVEMAARAALLLDHVDGWLVGQRSLINARTRSLLPVLTQRQALADHLVRVLEKLGLDRVPRKVTDLASYLQQQYGQGTLEPHRTPLAPHEATEQLSSGEDQPTPGGNATS
jgi:hypothetical protein